MSSTKPKRTLKEYMMEEALKSHPKSRLIKEIQKNNVKGYSKLSKPELIKLMMNERNIEKFRYIKDAKLEKAIKREEEKDKQKPKPKPAPKQAPKPAPKQAPKKDDSVLLPLKKLNPDKIKNFSQFKKSIRNLSSLLFTKKNTELEVEPVVEKLVKKILSIDNSEEMKGKVDSFLDNWFGGDYRWKNFKLKKEIRRIIKRSDKDLNIF